MLEFVNKIGTDVGTLLTNEPARDPRGVGIEFTNDPARESLRNCARDTERSTPETATPAGDLEVRGLLASFWIEP